MKLFLLLFLHVHAFLNEFSACCETGYFAVDGQCKQCPPNCSSCLSDSLCTLCKLGFYGDSCSVPCIKNCHDDGCNKTTGLCLSCKERYYSDENKICLKCPRFCISCKSKNSCFECETGYTGETCEKICSICQENTIFNKDTGYCEDSCRDGLSGELCNIRCDPKCMSCNRANYNECIACVPQRYGNYCNETCSRRCVDRTCNDSNGICTYGCLEGYWGLTCEQSCSKYCKNFVCDILSGTCLEGCVEGYLGNLCTTARRKKPGAQLRLMTGFVVTAVFVIAMVISFSIYAKRTHISRRFKRCHYNTLRAISDCVCLSWVNKYIYEGGTDNVELTDLKTPLNKSPESSEDIFLQPTQAKYEDEEHIIERNKEPP